MKLAARMDNTAEKLKVITKRLEMAAAKLRIVGRNSNVIVGMREDASLEDLATMAEKILASGDKRPMPERKLQYHEYVELSSTDEIEKFRQLFPITSEEIMLTDFDMLMDRFATDDT